jgi:DNA-binding NtrC family response regulator
VQAYAALGVLPEAVRARNAAASAGFRDVIDVRRPYAEQKDEILDRFTTAYLQELLAFTGGNQSEAARLSGINRGYLGRLLVKHGVRTAGSLDEDD